MKLTVLGSKFHDLFLQFQGKPGLIQELFSNLVAVYSSKERYYHNLSHIQHVLATIDTLEGFADDLPAIKMAAWFHDVIYEPQSNTNEERSAEFAFSSLTELGVPTATINHVVSIILYSKNHYAPLDDRDGQIFLDADLSILGSEKLEYMAYAQAIRREYSWLSDQEYKNGRKQVLQGFLLRENIYFTEVASQLFELQARENIRNELLALSQ